jgi:hypothetical protein
MTDRKMSTDDRHDGNNAARSSDLPIILGLVGKAITAIACVVALLGGINAFLSLSGKAKFETVAAFGIMLLAIAFIVMLYFYTRKARRAPWLTFLAICGLATAIVIAIAASIIAFRLASPAAHDTATPDPPVSQGSTASQSPVMTPASQEPVGPPSSITIPMSEACKWAYPGQASGKTVGSLYNTYCLGTNGETLGGFSGIHSLNNWCAIPSHTDGENGLQPELVNEVWVCT